MGIKQVSVTFEIDTETFLVSNVHSFVDGVEKKKTTTRRASSKKDETIEDEAIIIREDNKLVFNNKAYLDMGLTTDHRIVLKYEVIDDKRFPVIGTDEAWDQEGSGNKVTKSKTSSYRGKVNVFLQEYGTKFKIEPYKDVLWKMLPENEINFFSTYEEVEKKAETIDVNLMTTDEKDIEIEELTFKL